MNSPRADALAYLAEARRLLEKETTGPAFQLSIVERVQLRRYLELAEARVCRWARAGG